MSGEKKLKFTLEKLDLVLVIFFIVMAFIAGYMISGVASSSNNLPSPANRIKNRDILFSDNVFCLYYGNISVNSVAGTKSMDPIMDKGTQTVQFMPNNISNLIVGDIITYKYGERSYIHRIVEIKNGHIKVKGDNNKFPDPITLSFSDVTGVVIAIIY